MHPAGHQHPSNHPPISFRPNNISSRPNTDGMIYVETAMPPPHPPSSQNQPGNQQPGSNQQIPEVAGVLRRNQACLACRRRKLKCDALRPHCSTCVRSHKHLMRTSPKTNPVLTCDYDDMPGDGANDRDGRSVGSGDGDEDADGSKKKRRKGTSESKKRNNSKKDEEDEETERLRRKIEALEAQLAINRDVSTSVREPQDEPNRSWSSGTKYFHATTQPKASQYTDASAPSPTAFLDMLSSAASEQIPESVNVRGFRSGASQSAMMTEASSWNPASKDSEQQPTGLTPFLSYNDSQAIDNASASIETSQGQTPDHTAEFASRRPTQYSISRLSNGGNAGSSPAPNSLLSPMNVLNFSPGPSGPNISDPAPNNLNWAPPPGPDGQIQPSNRLEGPWRSIETVDTVFQNFGNDVPSLKDPTAGLPIQQAPDVDMEGLEGIDEAVQQQLLMDLFWPGWPANLPEPHIVNELAEAFFDLVPNLPRLLNRARFLSRLALPPTHSNFPHPALIHAICSSASTWCSPTVFQHAVFKLDSISCLNPMSGADPISEKSMSFGLKQAAYAKDAVQDGLNNGNRLFDVVRAMIILSRVFIDDTRMLECWAYAGLVARMILPLGLNVRSAELALKSVMLPPPVDALEREERRVAVWMAFYHDTIASAASGWGGSMVLDELSVPLPVSEKEFDLGLEHMEPNPQDIESPDLWTKHPVVDAFVMVTKASVLLNRVNKFVRKWKNRHLREDDDYDGLQRPEFRELANAIACFQMSFPPPLRNPCKLNSKKKLDIDLIAAHLIPHAAVICLYEAFADVIDPNDPSARRILGAAQNIVSIVQQLASVVNDGAQNFTAIMHSSASVCLVTAARTCLLFYRHALNMNDLSMAESLRMDIEMIRMALGQFGLRFKIGHHHSQLIEYFVDRATHPTLEKLQAHYPEHPRPGAPELHANANLGVCVLNALNIKRGYWRSPRQSHSSGVSPFTSTPESATCSSGSSDPSLPVSTESRQRSTSANLLRVDSRGAFVGAGLRLSGDDYGHPGWPPYPRVFGEDSSSSDENLKRFEESRTGFGEQHKSSAIG